MFHETLEKIAAGIPVCSSSMTCMSQVNRHAHWDSDLPQ